MLRLVKHSHTALANNTGLLLADDGDDDDDEFNTRLQPLQAAAQAAAAAAAAPPPGVLRPGIVHRLDKGTSGLMVVAKDDLAHTRLCDQFKARTVRRLLQRGGLVMGLVAAC